MKHLKKEQIFVILFSIIIMTYLSKVMLNIDIGNSDKNYYFIKYRSSIDSVKNVEKLLADKNKEKVIYKRDLFNYKVEKKKVEKKKEIKKIKFLPVWVKDGIKPYTSENIKMLFVIDGSAKFLVNGKRKNFSVGEYIDVGQYVEREKNSVNGKMTGNERVGKKYSGKILYISERDTWVELPQKDKVLRIKPHNDPEIISKSLLPGKGKESSVDSNDKRRGRRRK